ncbi:MAG: adenylate/guanylate cyclase domain-containing protein [Candidatus Sericytochromatia bacterium]|nr:adenylate/guanylate cyclase domain-containing protein [Candidatus Sericytochromatia bacterium]
MGTNIVRTWSASVSAPPESVWTWVADTRRFNRALGVDFPLTGYEGSPEGEVDLYGTHDLGRFREQPFQWIEPESFASCREFIEGPLEELRTQVRLAPGVDDSDGPMTHLQYTVKCVVREGVPEEVTGALDGMLTSFGGGILDLCAAMNARYRAGQPAVYVPPPPELDDAALARIAAIGDRLRQNGRLSPVAIDRLLALVRTGGDVEAWRMRPIALARAWGIPSHEVVRVFLHATQAGLLDLHWEMTCPHCRGVAEDRGHLAEVTAVAACAYCVVEVTPDLASSVEVTFRPNAAVRRIEFRMYCSGGPLAMPHVLSQVVVPPHDSRELLLDLGHGAYRVRAQWRQQACIVEIAEAAGPGAGQPELVELRCGDGGLDRAQLQHASGRFRLAVDNVSDKPIRLLVERTAWADDRLTAAALTSHRDFRHMFGHEVLAQGTQVTLSRQTILFTDLKNSTQMYEDIGDALSFSLVRDHFVVMDEAIDAFGGAIVKTIGDAVMAVFDDPVAAVRSAFRMQRELQAFNATSGRPPLTLKVGIHAGPGIAVTLNDRLDYFGTTVNMAARVQGESVGDDIVLSEAVCADPGVRDLLAAEAAPREPYKATLKGLGGQHELTRLWPLRVPARV